MCSVLLWLLSTRLMGLLWQWLGPMLLGLLGLLGLFGLPRPCARGGRIGIGERAGVFRAVALLQEGGFAQFFRLRRKHTDRSRRCTYKQSMDISDIVVTPFDVLATSVPPMGAIRCLLLAWV
jgi:hypothetical protein